MGKVCKNSKPLIKGKAVKTQSPQYKEKLVKKSKVPSIEEKFVKTQGSQYTGKFVKKQSLQYRVEILKT